MTTPELDLSEAGLKLDHAGAVATVTLNRPEVRNAQHPRMWAAMVQALESLDDRVRVVVVRGAGPTFSAGLDLSLLDPSRSDDDNLVATARRSDQEIIDTIGVYQRPFAMLAQGPWISLAAVHAHAIGAGFQLALACDLRIATPDASFCMKEPALGLVPDLAGTKPLVDAVGYARALEICATARRIPAEEAYALGIVQELVEDLDAAVERWTTALTAHSASAIRATKALLRAAPGRTLDEQRLAERTAQVEQFRELLAAR